MVIKAWPHLSVFCRIAHQHTVTTDNPTLYLVEPKHSTKLYTLAQLTFTYDRCMRLEQAHYLLCRGDTLPLQHPHGRLGYHLLYAWYKCINLPDEPPHQSLHHTASVSVTVHML